MQEKIRLGLLAEELKEVTGVAQAAPQYDTALTEAQIDDEKDCLYHAKQNQKISEQLVSGELDPTLYRGQNGYQSYFKLSDQQLLRKKVAGTLRGS